MINILPKRNYLSKLRHDNLLFRLCRRMKLEYYKISGYSREMFWKSFIEIRRRIYSYLSKSNVLSLDVVSYELAFYFSFTLLMLIFSFLWSQNTSFLVDKKLHRVQNLLDLSTKFNLIILSYRGGKILVAGDWHIY